MKSVILSSFLLGLVTGILCGTLLTEFANNKPQEKESPEEVVCQVSTTHIKSMEVSLVGAIFFYSPQVDTIQGSYNQYIRVGKDSFIIK